MERSRRGGINMRCCGLCKDEMHPELERHTVEYGVICDICYDELDEDNRIKKVSIQGD